MNTIDLIASHVEAQTSAIFSELCDSQEFKDILLLGLASQLEPREMAHRLVTYSHNNLI